jgi:putative ABC transport system permease protein
MSRLYSALQSSARDLLRDARYTARLLSRSPGFTALAVVMMALGIGSTTTIFSLSYGVLIRPLPWPEPDRVVRLRETRGGNPGRVPWTISNTTYHAWRESPTTVEDIGGWTRSQSMTLTTGGAGAERLRVGSVTPGLLRVLQVRPIAGRVFEDTDRDGRAGAGVVILGSAVWRGRFAAQTDVIGRTVHLDDRLLTVIGVMPPEFVFPDRDTEAWIPLAPPDVQAGAQVIRAMIFNVMARLRPGVTPEQAAAEGTSRGRAAPRLGQAAAALFGTTGEVDVHAVPARDAMTADVRPALSVLPVAVGLLFLAAAASVTLLQSVRAVGRRREMAVRAAIGAGPSRLARQWLVESAMLGAAGGAAGLLLASVLHRILPAILPPDFPRANEIRLDASVALFAAALTLLVTIVCGLVPAFHTRDVNLVSALGDTPGSTSWGTRTRAAGVRTAMMILQIAIACVLLVGAALLARSFTALVTADRGFDPRNVLTAHITTKGYSFAARAAELERVQERLAQLPGVTHAGFGNALPFVTTGGFRGLKLPSPHDPSTPLQAQALVRTVSPGYFAALGLRIIAGRPLQHTDSAASRAVVVVNRTFARQYLGDEPLGTVLPMVAGARRDWEVVGVVDDMRQGGLSGVVPSQFGGLEDPRQPEMYFSYRQWDLNVSELVYVVRSGADPADLAPALRQIIRDEDASLVLDSILTMEERVMNSLSRPRTYAVLLGGFAVFAIAIAGVGLFGVMSYMAAQRTREIGLRAALGARPRDIVRLVGREAAVMTLAGVALGLVAAFVLSRSLASILYGVSTRDIVSFVLVPILLVCVAAAACAAPVRRALRVSPLVALRG